MGIAFAFHFTPMYYKNSIKMKKKLIEKMLTKKYFPSIYFFFYSDTCKYIIQVKYAYMKMEPICKGFVRTEFKIVSQKKNYALVRAYVKPEGAFVKHYF